MPEKVAHAGKKAIGISLRVVLVLGVSALLLLLLFYITDDIVLDHGQAFDNAGFQFLQQYTTPAATRFMLFCTFFGSQKFLLPAYILLCLYYIFIEKNRSWSINIAAIGISSVILLFAVKHIFKRHRPLHPLINNVQGFSYPSGHSFSAFTFCFLLMYLTWESGVNIVFKWLASLLLFICAALVAVSRVYLHVHYPSDVLAGFCLSFIWLAMCIYLLQKIHSPSTF